MMKYKVGDKVKIRNDLVIWKTYGTCFVTPSMHNLCGKIVHITDVSEYHGEYRIAPYSCWWTDEMFEDVDVEVQGMNKRVVIDTHENYVIARCGDKEGVARCHPDDKFDFYIGAKIALERLEEAEKPYGWLKKEARYYFPVPAISDLYNSSIYVADDWDKRVMERGIVFQTKEEAIACAKKMLAVVKQEG